VRGAPVRSIMGAPFRYVDIETPLPLLAPMITPESPAVLVRDFPANKTYILTGYDVLAAM
jgi:predicted transcriptional regulator